MGFAFEMSSDWADLTFEKPVKPKPEGARRGSLPAPTLPAAPGLPAPARRPSGTPAASPPSRRSR